MLTEFLLARIAEDEAAANEYPELGGLRDHWELTFTFDRDYCEPMDVAIAPERILAECEAKRRIVVEARRYDLDPEGVRAAMSDGDEGPYVADLALKALALPYADHPDYREEWAC